MRDCIEHTKRRAEARMLHDLGCGGGIYQDGWKEKTGEMEGGRIGGEGRKGE